MSVCVGMMSVVLEILLYTHGVWCCNGVGGGGGDDRIVL